MLPVILPATLKVSAMAVVEAKKGIVLPLRRLLAGVGDFTSAVVGAGAGAGVEPRAGVGGEITNEKGAAMAVTTAATSTPSMAGT